MKEMKQTPAQSPPLGDGTAAPYKYPVTEHPTLSQEEYAKSLELREFLLARLKRVDAARIELILEIEALRTLLGLPDTALEEFKAWLEEEKGSVI